ncbi:TrpH protein (plasmid) [Legionella adelaidensis]|uniref:TrpH protein n=1 Tax=Legionella adelaidensis TaxID=45056 RepID=A0A0W0R4E5_9GAMM|nr:PHP domain-containing protein [Legionella adelaidensis]KTC65933.1 TrpH protein [Legionella adelaidensis]VEH85553.1 TrpH protein [Legionella adelaidensis]
MIDLHCHSHFSDGELHPNDLYLKARQNGVKTLALTDHDTVDGVRLLQKAATDNTIQIISGIEFSTRWKKHDIHIVGLNIDINSAALNTLINRQKESRLQRAIHIAERVEAIGIKDALEKAKAISGHEGIGRPHFAKVFVNEGLARDMQDAFKRYLGRGRKAYVHTPWISIEEAVEGILQAGGAAVLAHPLKYSLTRTKLNELIQAFKMAGGTAIEVISGAMKTDQIKDMCALCNRFNLLASTGSDFHGEKLSPVSLGQQPLLPLNCNPVWQNWNNEKEGSSQREI